MIKMKIWQSYASNHSTHFVTTGLFKTSQQAVTVASWIAKVLGAFGIDHEDFEIKTKNNRVIVKYYAMNPNEELEDFLANEGAKVKTEIK